MWSYQPSDPRSSMTGYEGSLTSAEQVMCNIASDRSRFGTRSSVLLSLFGGKRAVRYAYVFCHMSGYSHKAVAFVMGRYVGQSRPHSGAVLVVDV